MNLPNELVSEFVKATSNNTKSKSETTVYGTVVIKDESKYVKLDGSDVETPVLTTTNVSDKDRVIVRIKNHTATVIGNVAKPSARLIDVTTITSGITDEISSNLATTTEGIVNIDKDLQDWVNNYSKYISFSGDGIIIGSGENTLTLEISDQNGIVFKKNGVQFGVWDGVDFHTGSIVVDVNERARFGNFAFVPRSDGSLMFLKVGE